MKKAMILAIAFAFCLGMAAPVLASDLPAPMDKLMNGMIDVVKSPLELYDHTKHEFDHNDNKAFGLLKGLIESPFHVVDKAGRGVIDIATFPIE